MPKALTVCSKPNCPTLTDGGRCPAHRRATDQARGSRLERGYGRAHETRFRPGVLRRDPRCVCDDKAHDHDVPCGAPSTVADHHPRSRRELVARGLDADDPKFGRGVCKRCHDKSTAVNQPGGWNAR